VPLGTERTGHIIRGGRIRDARQIYLSSLRSHQRASPHPNRGWRQSRDAFEGKRRIHSCGENKTSRGPAKQNGLQLSTASHPAGHFNQLPQACTGKRLRTFPAAPHGRKGKTPVAPGLLRPDASVSRTAIQDNFGNIDQRFDVFDVGRRNNPSTICRGHDPVEQSFETLVKVFPNILNGGRLRSIGTQQSRGYRLFCFGPCGAAGNVRSAGVTRGN